MDHFAGLDVSVKETSICIVDDAGKIVREVKVASEPEALLAVLKNLAYHFKRIGLEAGRAPGADSEEKHEPVSDIDTVVVDSLKALDPEWPIREADIAPRGWYGRKLPGPDISRPVIRSACRREAGTLRKW
jgi:hypothetical protein